MELWKYFLRRAYEEATKSPDPSTQNGAIVVAMTTKDRSYTRPESHLILGGDCNRFPIGVRNTWERWHDRDLKYKFVHHAERTTLDTVRRMHNLAHLDNWTLVCPWAACTDCAKEIIAAGITTLVTHKQAHDRTPPGSVWFDEIIVAHQMLREAGVEVISYDGKVGGPPVRHSGVIWTP